MRDLIPRKDYDNHDDDDDDDDVLNSDLKAQFELLQHLISNKQDKGETHHGKPGSKVDEKVVHMAVSASISVQREINGLLNGIAELEQMLHEDSSVPNVKESNEISNSLLELDNGRTKKHAGGVKDDIDGKDKPGTHLSRKEHVLSNIDER